jgi:hypothetical protein
MNLTFTRKLYNEQAAPLSRDGIALVFATLDARFVKLLQIIEFNLRILRKIFVAVLKKHNETECRYEKQNEPKKLSNQSHWGHINRRDGVRQR